MYIVPGTFTTSSSPNYIVLSHNISGMAEWNALSISIYQYIYILYISMYRSMLNNYLKSWLTYLLT